jgi:hypothetical protein
MAAFRDKVDKLSDPINTGHFLTSCATSKCSRKECLIETGEPSWWHHPFSGVTKFERKSTVQNRQQVSVLPGNFITLTDSVTQLLNFITESCIVEKVLDRRKAVLVITIISRQVPSPGNHFNTCRATSEGNLGLCHCSPDCSLPSYCSACTSRNNNSSSKIRSHFFEKLRVAQPVKFPAPPSPPFWNTNFHYRVHCSLPPVSILRHTIQ